MTEEMKLDVDSAVTSVGLTSSPSEIDVLSLDTPNSPLEEKNPTVSSQSTKATEQTTSHADEVNSAGSRQSPPTNTAMPPPVVVTETPPRNQEAMYTYKPSSPAEDDDKGGGGIGKCHVGMYRPSQPDLVQTAEAMSSGITTALHTISRVSSFFPNGVSVNPSECSTQAERVANLGACNINDSCITTTTNDPENSSAKKVSPNQVTAEFHHLAEEKKEEHPMHVCSDDESGLMPPPKIYDSRIPTPQGTKNGSPNNSSNMPLYRPIAIPAAAAVSPESIAPNDIDIRKSPSNRSNDSPSVISPKSLIEGHEETEIDNRQDFDKMGKEQGNNVAVQEDQQQHQEESPDLQHSQQPEQEQQQMSRPSHPPPQLVEEVAPVSDNPPTVTDDEGAADVGGDVDNVGSGNGKKQVYTNSSPMARLRAHSSPMARMRDHASQRESAVDEDGTSTTMSRGQKSHKSHEQVKAEKQRRWKRQLKKAKAKKRQERRELEDESYSDVTSAAGGNTFVDLVLTTVVPARDRAFVKGLIQSRCGNLDDVLSDSEDYSADSSSAGSALSSEVESRGSEALGSRSRRRRRRRRNKEKRRRSSGVVYGMKSGMHLKSRSRSEASQSQPSESSMGSEGDASFTRRSNSSKDYGEESDRRRDRSPGAPLSKGKRKSEMSRNPSPSRSIPTTHVGDSQILVSPQSTLPSYASDHSIIASPIKAQSDVTLEHALQHEINTKALMQPALGHRRDPRNAHTKHRPSEENLTRNEMIDADQNSKDQPEPELPTDKSFVKSFIQEIVSRGIELHWHKEQASMCPTKIRLNIKPGYRKPNGCFCGPRLGWFDVDDVGNTFGIDLFDIRALERASPRNLTDYPYAIPSRSVVLKSSRLGDFVFEARTEAGARHFIHGMRWVVARLAFNLIIGNLDVSCELLDVGLIVEKGMHRAPDTPLEEAHWTNAMNDVTNQLIEKSI